MNDVRYHEITSNEESQRLDNFLARVLKGVPKSCIYRIIRAGEVRVNKKRAKPSTRLMEGDMVRIPPIRTAAETPVYVGDKLSERLMASILYEDERLIVLNKPSGIAVHGGSGLSLGVIEALRKIRTDLPYLELVHRLDRETSGCLLLAKKRSCLREIQQLLEARAVTKTYWAILAHPWVGAKKQLVEVPLEKNILKSGERLVTANEQGKASETLFQLLENYQEACWVQAMPKTGRTHQIRVHSAYLGHPIVGDEKYGKKDVIEALKSCPVRLYLHARSIQFNLNDKKQVFEAPVDEVFSNALKQLRAGSKLIYE